MVVVVCGGGSVTVRGGDGRSIISRRFNIYCRQRVTRYAASGCRERAVSNWTCLTPLRVHTHVLAENYLELEEDHILHPRFAEKCLELCSEITFAEAKTRSIHSKTFKKRLNNAHKHTPVSPTLSSLPTWTTPCYHCGPAVATTTGAPAPPHVLSARRRHRLP